MQSIYEGSIEIIFAVILSVKDLVVGLKNLYELDKRDSIKTYQQEVE